ncbi:MAG: hypothetical protein KC420_04840, partial [Myxococcales bacterium]|nr:hypothetical protein [Myxococcales bacterium]
RIATSRDREQKIRGRLTSALLYPAVLVVLAIGAVIFIMVSSGDLNANNLDAIIFEQIRDELAGWGKR